MIFPTDEIVVTDIAGDNARVHATSLLQKSELIRIGFIEQADTMERHLHSAMDRVSVVLMLIELGALFSAGRDWSPAELVQYYREQGFVNGSFRAIAWKNPEQFVISTR